MTAEIITLLEGPGRDGGGPNTSDFIVRELSALGIETEECSMVEQGGLALQNAMAAALARADIIVLLGGLGVGGVTLRAVAEGLDIPLEEHRESLMHAADYYTHRELEPPPGWQEQALLPKGAAVFRNERGPAPGCAISAGSQCILMLPGDAGELYPMVAEYAYLYLAEFCGERVACRTLRAFGLQDAEVAELLEDLLECENPIVSVYPHSGELLVRVTALAREGAEAPAQACLAMASRVRERLSWQMYGTDSDTLPQVAVRALRHQRLRTATAEFGTGGMLGLLLADAPGSGIACAEPILVRDGAECLRLTCVEPEEEEPPESVLWRVTAALAQRAGQRSGAETGLSAVIERDESGALTQACAVLYADGQVWARIMPAVRGAQSEERTARMVALHALDMLRLYLDGPPDALPDGEAVEPLGEELPEPAARGKRRKPLRAAKPSGAQEKGQKQGKLGFFNFFWPSRGDSKADIARKVILLVAAVILLGALGYLGWSYALGPDSERAAWASSEEESSTEPEEETSVEEPEMSSDALPESEISSEESSLQESSSLSLSSSSSSASVVSSSSTASVSSVSSSSTQSSNISATSSQTPSSSSSSSSAAPSSSSSSSVASSSTSSSSSSASSESEASGSEDFIPGKEVGAAANHTESSSSEDDEVSASGGAIAMDETVRVNGESMEAYDAICRIVMNETGGTMRKEAMKAQAVAAYSRLVARNGSVTGMGLRTANSTVRNAVKEVWGETVRSGGRTIDVFFGASTAGKTNTAKEVWGGTMAGHTQNVDSHWDESAPGYQYTKKMKRDDVIDAIYSALGVDLSDVPDDEWFYVDSYTGGGYNDKMTVGGSKRTTGRYLRESVLSLRSACFEWEFDGDYVLFTTYGYGHGVGLSQQGANGMAAEGYGYVEILEHYYVGCTIG